ncbi:hypothetical protein [Glutamicibacter arilaitensis]|uniref:hypothetical protein n=1 Tax=Glutamicibacter arilaitensis TaxID=256701 RepID=UPI003F9BCE66
MTNPRLELALERLNDWKYFEDFASKFLVEDFPALRTMASPSGDGGRDAELFSNDSLPAVAFQYSLRKDWKPKIQETLSRLNQTRPSTRRIIYVTNQVIGAKSDDMKEIAWESYDIRLDIFDRNWFLERSHTTDQRKKACQDLCTFVVDPLLENRHSQFSAGNQLMQDESRQALLHLALDRRDTDNQRSLTKSCFDSLILAALDGSTSENLLTLAEIQETVRSILPNAHPEQLNQLVVSALVRSTRKSGPVKENKKLGGFHISFTETERLRDEQASQQLDEDALLADIRAAFYGIDDRLDNDEVASHEVALRVREILEGVLLQQGESFVAAINSPSSDSSVVNDLEELLPDDISPWPFSPGRLATCISDVLFGPSDRAMQYLKRLLDAYTLLAFLKQTPDVQKTLSKAFGDGEIWLDTSAVLPLIAETFIEVPSDRRFTSLIAATTAAGLKLFITDGALEEIDAHLNMCLSCSHSNNWQGRLPFVYAAYVLSGQRTEAFDNWLLEIRGASRPKEDIAEYIQEEFGITHHPLLVESDEASIELRAAVYELWATANEKRRSDSQMDPSSKERLIRNDVESTVGIIQLRRGVSESGLGYRQWWLTLDRTAQKLSHHLKEFLGPEAPASPVLSPDFLSHLLRIGPLRRNLVSSEVNTLPAFTELSKLRNVPPCACNARRRTTRKFWKPERTTITT